MPSAIVFFIAMTGAAVQAVTGFGYGILVMAVLPLFLPMEQAVMVSTMTSMLLNCTVLAPRIRHAQVRYVWLPVLFSSAAGAAGLFWLSGSSPALYKRLLGLLLCALAVWFLCFSKRVRIRATAASAAAAGAVSGVCGALFSISGPPMVLYYVSVLDDSQQYMATTQLYFMINNLVTLALRAAFGLWPSGLTSPVCCAAAGLAIGAWIGSRLFRKLDGAAVKKFVYVFMALSGVYIALGG